jgi:uncharacterized protein (DUF2252 family)
MILKTVEKARATTNETLLPKVVHRQKDGGWRFVEDPPILTRVGNDTRKKIIESLKDYAESVPQGYRHMLRRYSVADVAHRVVGVGSVGIRAYLVLLFGNGDHDPLFLQVKESVVPAHAPYLPHPARPRESIEGCLSNAAGTITKELMNRNTLQQITSICVTAISAKSSQIRQNRLVVRSRTCHFERIRALSGAEFRASILRRLIPTQA